MAEIDKRYVGQSSGISNPYLLNTMQAVAQDDTSEHREAFYRALLKSVLILPTSERSVEGLAPQKQTLTQDTVADLVVFRNPEGELVLLAFTDRDAVLAWRPEGTPYLALPAVDLFSLAAQNRVSEILINPVGPVRGQLTREEIVTLAQSQAAPSTETASEQIPAGTSVLIARPVPPSDAWIQQVRAALSRAPLIKTTYLFQMKTPSADPALVLGVRFESQTSTMDQHAAMQTLMEDLGGSLEPRLPLNFIVLEPGDFLKLVQDTALLILKRDS